MCGCRWTWTRWDSCDGGVILRAEAEPPPCLTTSTTAISSAGARPRPSGCAGRGGERVNDLDWEHVIEGIEDVGKSQLEAVRSLLALAIEHALRAGAWPDHAAARKWRNEVATFLGQARRRYEPGMAQNLDIVDLYADALAVVRSLDMRRPGRLLPEAITLAPSDLADRACGPDELLARIGEAPDAGGGARCPDDLYDSGYPRLEQGPGRAPPPRRRWRAGERRRLGARDRGGRGRGEGRAEGGTLAVRARNRACAEGRGLARALSVRLGTHVQRPSLRVSSMTAAA